MHIKEKNHRTEVIRTKMTKMKERMRKNLSTKIIYETLRMMYIYGVFKSQRQSSLPTTYHKNLNNITLQMLNFLSSRNLLYELRENI